MIVVDDHILIQDLQANFQEKFPYLKIEFYVKPHEIGKGTSPSQQLDGNKTIGEVRTIHTEGEISIHGNQKISTLEQSFSEKYGLNVQVFRKSANLWLQTTKTDHWTLSEANQKGAHSVKLTEDKIYPNQ